MILRCSLTTVGGEDETRRLAYGRSVRPALPGAGQLGLYVVSGGNRLIGHAVVGVQELRERLDQRVGIAVVEEGDLTAALDLAIDRRRHHAMQGGQPGVVGVPTGGV